MYYILTSTQGIPQAPHDPEGVWVVGAYQTERGAVKAAEQMKGLATAREYRVMEAGGRGELRQRLAQEGGKEQ